MLLCATNQAGPFSRLSTALAWALMLVEAGYRVEVIKDGDLADSDLHEQSEGFKSLTAVPGKRSSGEVI